MANIEQVERLREKANVTYEEAKEALDACNGDLLDAIIYLEKKGKVRSEGGYYSSQKETPAGASAEIPPEDVPEGNGFSDLLKRFGAFCLKLIHKGNENTFEIFRRGESKTYMPVTVLVLLLIFAFWITIPLLIVGMFFGFRYRFNGPDQGKSVVNDPINSAADAAEELKNSITNNK
jgi:hypothetical protein